MYINVFRILCFCANCSFFFNYISQKEGLSDLDSLISLTYNLLENETTEPIIIFVDAINQVCCSHKIFCAKIICAHRFSSEIAKPHHQPTYSLPVLLISHFL